MKIMKKVNAFLLAVCFSIFCFPFVAHAADGRISFTDPQTAVGEIVEVKCVARSENGDIANIEVKLTYDNEALRFDSGDSGVTDDGNGTLTYSGTGSSSEVSFIVKFQALKEGTTNVEISSATVTSSTGNTLNLENGQSAVTIAEGDPSKIQDTSSSSSKAEDMQVEVDGTSYTLTDSFADADIPSGYARTQVSLEGQERQMVTNKSNGVILGYLLDSSENGDFFLYNEDNATFSSYEEVAISDTMSIIILDDNSSVKLPDRYVEVKMTLNGKDFPVWQDSENAGYYILYAINSNGDTGYYQYDSEEDTYQRFVVLKEDEKADSSSFVGKLQNLFDNYFKILLIIAGLGLIFIFIIILVLAVKLHHRNVELDDLYDEYGIDLEDEDELEQPVPKKASGKGKKKAKAAEEDGPAVRKPVREVRIEEEDDFEVFEPEPLDEEAFDNFEGYFGNSEYDDEGYDGSDDFIDDTTDLLSSHPEKKRGHTEFDDTFKMDIIDLD